MESDSGQRVVLVKNSISSDKSRLVQIDTLHPLFVSVGIEMGPDRIIGKK